MVSDQRGSVKGRESKDNVGNNEEMTEVQRKRIKESGEEGIKERKDNRRKEGDRQVIKNTGNI